MRRLTLGRRHRHDVGPRRDVRFRDLFRARHRVGIAVAVHGAVGQLQQRWSEGHPHRLEEQAQVGVGPRLRGRLRMDVDGPVAVRVNAAGGRRQRGQRANALVHPAGVGLEQPPVVGVEIGDALGGGVRQPDAAHEAIAAAGLAKSLGLAVGDRLTLLSTTVDGVINGLDTEIVCIYTTGVRELDERSVVVRLDTAQVLLHITGVLKLTVMLSNADHEVVHALYSGKGYQITEVRANRMINCDATRRGPITEVVVTNYKLAD